MARLSMTSFVTLDGVMQAPGGPKEDTSGGFAHGGWFMPLADPGFGEFIVGVFARAGAFLLGRGTYEIFASHWPRITDPDDPVAGPLNRLPKYVASRTLARAGWSGTTLVRDAAADVPRLKRELGAGELQVHGSPGLAQTLLREGLVDELHLVVAPLTLGSGKRLFGEGTVPAAFALAASRTTATGLAILTYRPKGKPSYGDATLKD
ncbi:dihydrofolate reductase family protein [Anaeromyxobacter paludicola]|uniref:Deaminase reductase n=1 Tax=Anaeromyxobacter paludicola TaxID=2918171 RepID=A0ABN6NFD3_9BACT|nr:dihydrofolate reductase family protein [Anaeromyxobacter paludicola]BDG10755.1 deaminase reductase [Anaeromyxobacter paludicola]